MTNVVITGSTRGIGRGLAKEFASRGHAVVISGRNPETCDSALDDLRQEVGDAATAAIACDVTDIDQVRRLWDGATQAMGGVDIWISNAGLSHPPVNFWDIETDEIGRLVNTNLLGVMYCAKVVIAGMQAQETGGALYNISGFGRGGELRPGIALYGATKRCIDYLSNALALECEGSNVLVGQIHPHFVVTDLSREAWVKSGGSEEKLQQFNRAAGAPLDVTARIVAGKILANKKNGALIVRDSRLKAFMRRLRAKF